MPVRGLVFYKGGYYHLYCRGVEKRHIFLDRTDYRRFLSKLGDYKIKHHIKIIAYCLMPNHYHLLVCQERDDTPSDFIHRLNLAYSMYFNKRYERVGPLFQGRFKSKIVDSDEYLLQLSKYIHLNPKEVVPNNRLLSSYFWSSYPAYLSLRQDGVVETKQVLGYFSKSNPTSDYKSFVEEEAASFEIPAEFKSGT